MDSEIGSFDAVDKWSEFRQRLQAAQESVPDIPSTLQVELRDYQAEGFRWLARIADWGFGACLADDMGLGKTIQALALLVRRADRGPALVVAPASVCGNWAHEARRFASTLNVHHFDGSDRERLVPALGPFDVLLCTYGLMQNEVDLLSSQQWSTLVLDESQAIKNPAAKRSKAAKKLPAMFRLAMSGTPIENHLDELWSLFDFLNPGLLGSLNAYRTRFGVGVNQTPEARSRLRRLIRPFILRRTKSQVLDELPRRTEITLSLDISPEEAALYEALRLRAVDAVDEAAAAGKDGRFALLAQLTKLRRACCSPSLVDPEFGSKGSKLEVFDGLLDELVENRHKALVFSQFVDYLHILRDHLDERGVRYQFLDGSTPTAKRRDITEAFQRGDGDVFLISLKAGGLGLNLTAASYVILMDPWWNPAVEQQASDRAHRIGQSLPVTIYRLVARGTIEEKVLQLHAKKRELADRLLDGAEQGARLSIEEIRALLGAEDG